MERLINKLGSMPTRRRPPCRNFSPLDPIGHPFGKVQLTGVLSTWAPYQPCDPRPFTPMFRSKGSSLGLVNMIFRRKMRMNQRFPDLKWSRAVIGELLGL